MGHLSGGWADLLGFAEAGEGGAGAEGAAAGGAGEETAWGGGGWDGSMEWCIGDCIVITGAACGGGSKASFFLIINSQSSCLSCSSMISLESTSLYVKEIYINCTTLVWRSYIRQIILIMKITRKSLWWLTLHGINPGKRIMIVIPLWWHLNHHYIIDCMTSSKKSGPLSLPIIPSRFGICCRFWCKVTV